MGDTIVKIYQKQNFVIGEDILKAIKQNNLTLNEALLIIYFCGNTHPVLDIEDIKNKFAMEELDIMRAFESISDKNLVSIKMQKNNDNKIEEVIDLTPLYESIAMNLNEIKREEDSANIFSSFENEMGRPLSSMEYEVINGWLDKGIGEKLIKAALKEAIFNGTLTLRYIDAILSEWSRKGFKDEKDVELYLKRKKPKLKTKEEELFDYNWLDDEN